MRGRAAGGRLPAALLCLAFALVGRAALAGTHEAAKALVRKAATFKARQILGRDVAAAPASAPPGTQPRDPQLAAFASVLWATARSRLPLPNSGRVDRTPLFGRATDYLTSQGLRWEELPHSSPADFVAQVNKLLTTAALRASATRPAGQQPCGNTMVVVTHPSPARACEVRNILSYPPFQRAERVALVEGIAYHPPLDRWLALATRVLCSLGGESAGGLLRGAQGGPPGGRGRSNPTAPPPNIHLTGQERYQCVAATLAQTLLEATDGPPASGQPEDAQPAARLYLHQPWIWANGKGSTHEQIGPVVQAVARWLDMDLQEVPTPSATPGASAELAGTDFRVDGAWQARGNGGPPVEIYSVGHNHGAP